MLLNAAMPLCWRTHKCFKVLARHRCSTAPVTSNHLYGSTVRYVVFDQHGKIAEVMLSGPLCS
eukprot:4630606-Amphidinium_carterae.1